MQVGNFSDQFGFPNQLTQQGGGGLNVENRGGLQMPQNAPNQPVQINQPSRIEQGVTFEKPTGNQRSTRPQTAKGQRLTIQRPLPQQQTPNIGHQADEPENKNTITKKLMLEFNSLGNNYRKPGVLNLMEKILVKIMNLWR